MTIYDILSKLDEVLDEVKNISSRVGKIEERTERIEALYNRNDSVVILSTPKKERASNKTVPPSHKPVEDGAQRPSQPMAELPGEPEFAEKAVDYPELPPFPDPDPKLSVQQTAASTRELCQNTSWK